MKKPTARKAKSATPDTELERTVAQLVAEPTPSEMIEAIHRSAESLDPKDAMLDIRRLTAAMRFIRRYSDVFNAMVEERRKAVPPAVKKLDALCRKFAKVKSRNP